MQSAAPDGSYMQQAEREDQKLMTVCFFQLVSAFHICYTAEHALDDSDGYSYTAQPMLTKSVSMLGPSCMDACCSPSSH